MQLPRSEGLGAAFGGAVTENIFGAQTTNVLAKFTVWLGVAFFAITLILAVVYTHQNNGKATSIQRSLMNAPIPTAAAAAPAVKAAAPVAPATTVAPTAAPTAAAASSMAAPALAAPAVSVPAAAPVASPMAAPASAPAATPMAAPTAAAVASPAQP